MANSDPFGPIISRTSVIGNLDSFILSNIPYAQVQPDALQWGNIEYDGPLAPGVGGTRPMLQWHFGGVPYPITKAIRIFYTYKRTWDNSDSVETAAIYLGFQNDVNIYSSSSAFPTPQTPGGFNASVALLQAGGGSGTQYLASGSALLARDAGNLVTGAPMQATPTFTDLVATELGTQLGTSFINKVRDATKTFTIDYDGPAQSSDSHNPFAYSLATIQQKQNLDKYERLVFWYFGGQAWRLTKVVRIPIEVAATASGANGSSAEVRAAAAFQREGAGLTLTPAAAAAAVLAQVAAAPDVATALGPSLFIGYAGLGSGSGG